MLYVIQPRQIHYPGDNYYKFCPLLSNGGKFITLHGDNYCVYRQPSLFTFSFCCGGWGGGGYIAPSALSCGGGRSKVLMAHFNFCSLISSRGNFITLATIVVFIGSTHLQLQQTHFIYCTMYKLRQTYKAWGRGVLCTFCVLLWRSPKF